MAEIESVKAMQDNNYFKTNDTSSMTEPAPENSLQQVSNIADKVFQIKTTAEGYNSGRIYYLRVSDDDNEVLCSNIIQSLQKSAQAARKRMEVISQFERIQKIMKKAHDSVGFQMLVGILIFVVCLSPRPSFASSSSLSTSLPGFRPR
jgi:hypothetical protein